MSVRAQIGLIPQPLRWLTAHPSVSWAAFAFIAMWFRGRQSHVDVPPVSSQWLLDNERQSIRAREL